MPTENVFFLLVTKASATFRVVFLQAMGAQQDEMPLAVFMTSGTTAYRFWFASCAVNVTPLLGHLYRFSTGLRTRIDKEEALDGLRRGYRKFCGKRYRRRLCLN